VDCLTIEVRVEQMAEEFPDVHFDGLDKGERTLWGAREISNDIGQVPVVADTPANLHYEVADFTQGMHYEAASIDIVQARQIIMGVRSLSLCRELVSHRLQLSDYPALLHECARILRPGGLFVSGEWSHFVVFDLAQHQSAERFPHMTRFASSLGTILERRGNHTRVDYIPDHVQNSGLFDVVLDVAYTVRIRN
jgi:SAM-dependent methyltransferase